MFLYLILQWFLKTSVLGETKEFKMADKQKHIQSFLNNISQVESSGGTNFNHPTVTSGIQAGDAAIGRYGLMPNTVNEVLNRMRLHGNLTPELQQLQQLDPATLKETLEKNPQLEDQIAGSLAGRVLDRQPDDETAAYSWHQGHNLKPDDIQQKDYQNDDYVKKFDMYKKMNEGEDNGE